MTKKEVIWLLIRLAGLWFLLQAVTGAVSLITLYFHTSQEPMLLEKSTWLLLQSAGAAALSFALGLYCVGDGRILFALLNREQPDDLYSGDGNSDSRRSTLGLP